MPRLILGLAFAATASVTLACSMEPHESEAPASHDVAKLQEPISAPPLAMDAEESAAYEACLEASQAVAMPWNAIEQQCLEQAKGSELEPVAQ